MSRCIPDCPFALFRDELRAMAAAIRVDDVDTAIEIGLLRYVSIAEHVEEHQDIARDSICAECAECDRIVAVARDSRLYALAARDRHRARELRLQARARLRAEKRAGAHATSASATSSTVDLMPATAKAPSLPPAAAAALARAKAKVLTKRGGEI
jgi:hypothetical protein